MSAKVFGPVRHAAHIVMALGMLVAFCSLRVSAAARVTLAWDASPDPTVTGYNLYYGGVTGQYTNTVNAGSGTSASVSNLVAGATYFFAATCYDAAGLESDYSSELPYTVPTSSGNQPPTLDLIANLTINENSGTRVVNLTGISPGSGTNLTITATSSNPSLIANPTVNYTFPNTTGSMSFTPAVNTFGTNLVTVLLDNGSAISNSLLRSFTITVAPVNAPPTLDPLSPLTITENSGPQTVALTGISSGTNGEIQALTVSAVSSNPGLIPNPSVSYSSANTSGTLTLAPVTNTFGSAVITVTVNDGQPTNNTLARAFTVTVNQVVVSNTPPTNTWSLYWQSSVGNLSLWSMNGTNAVSETDLTPSNVGVDWTIVGAANYAGGGEADLLWRSTLGSLVVGRMHGNICTQWVNLNPAQIDPAWKIVGTGDFGGNGKADLLWQSTAGSLVVGVMNGLVCTQWVNLNPAQIDPAWKIVGVADFNADGKPDILWRSTAGRLVVGLMNGTICTQWVDMSPAQMDPAWKIVGLADVDGDGQKDIIWESSLGELVVGLMQGTKCAKWTHLNPANVDPAWRIVAAR